MVEPGETVKLKVSWPEGWGTEDYKELINNLFEKLLPSVGPKRLLADFKETLIVMPLAWASEWEARGRAAERTSQATG